MPREVATEPPFLSHPPPLSDGNLHPAALLRMRGNYFRPYLSISACAIEVQHSNENSTTIFIDMIAPKEPLAMHKLTSFFSNFGTRLSVRLIEVSLYLENDFHQSYEI